MTPAELKAFMERHEVDTIDLAEFLDYSRSAVYRWLEGSRAVPKIVERVLIEWEQENGH